MSEEKANPRSVHELLHPLTLMFWDCTEFTWDLDDLYSNGLTYYLLKNFVDFRFIALLQKQVHHSLFEKYMLTD